MSRSNPGHQGTRHRLLRCVFSLILLALMGCSNGNPRTYSTRGIVKFPDGQPLTAGTIEFEAMDHEIPIMATAEIAGDGTFVLGTFSMDDGAVEGMHRVIVAANREIGTGAERPGMLKRPVLHPRFADFKTSGLKIEIEAGDNELTIPVEYIPRR